MKLGPVTLAENRLESGNWVATRPQYDDCRSFGTLSFGNGFEYRNSDYSMLFSHHFSTSCKILVRFGSAMPEFKTEEVVWPALINLPHLVELHLLGGLAVRHYGEQ